MGAGIFSMHFIGLMAFQHNSPLSYDPLLLFLSYGAATIASWGAFAALVYAPFCKKRRFASGVILGLAIALMHYIGIYSQLGQAGMEFKPFYFILSIIIAVGFCALALMVFFGKNPHSSFGARWAGAALLGAAISIVHYLGVKAVVHPARISGELPSGIHNETMALITTMGVLIILAVAIFSAFLDFQSIQTERVLLTKMQESEERFRRTIEASPEAIVIHSGKEIVFVNEACLKMIKRTDKNEFIGKSITDYVHPKFQKLVQERIQDMKNGLKGKPLEEKVATPDGNYMDVEISGIGIEFDGKPAIQLILRDVTEQKKTRKELIESQQLYLSLFEYNPDIVYSVDREGCITNVNRSITAILGYTENEFITMSFDKVISKENIALSWLHFEQALQGQPQNYEIVGVHKKGHPIPLDITNLPIMVDGEITGVFGIAKDISSEKQALQLLEENEEKYRSLFDHNLDAVFEIALDGSFKNVNKKAEELIQYSKEELYGMSYPSLILDDVKSVYKSFLKVKKGNSLYVDQKLIDRFGNLIEVDVSAVPIKKQGKVDGAFSIVRNVTEKKQTQKKIQELAFTDHLTGLPNRHWFYNNVSEMVQKAKSQNHSIAMLLIDFDDFKSINDLLGHHGGDLFLRLVSKRLSACLREQDKISRLGGDEFIVLIEDISTEEVAELADRILREMNRPIFLFDHEILTTLSIGISMLSECTSNDEMLIRHADIAMYSAKEKGKNNFQFFTEDLNSQITRKLQLENALRKAIELQEFQLYYQPQIDLQTGRLIGLEALIRWHSGIGVISPAEFIPMAEETGLIVPIGEWVIEEACRQMKEWESKGFRKVKISVNVSARQFKDHNFSKKVRGILAQQKVDPSSFEIEITESVMLNIEESSKLIEDLKRLGIKIAIDDFGAGYSSLNVIKNVEIDTLKIDKSLIDEVLDNQRNMSILTAIIEVGKSLHTDVVIEGIETKDQSEALKVFNVIGQGYFYSRPYPPDHLEQLWNKEWVLKN
ncbi:EAL domain-containing protein [Planococcus sp. YIM B11945]|uniref:bifunctional diguanylate cyclase/phosphodiesterase n=1 Tax=Planococcus sp. YIM B11945 TaxID=3435410 RepID=UPI003D7DDE9A